MRILAFNGSPRNNGNTDLLLQEALKPIEHAGHNVTKFNLNDLNIKACQDCGGCQRSGKCVVDDDMTMVSDAIRQAERIILASPIFFFGLSAQSKVMVDRCQSFWCEKYLLKQPIAGGTNGRKGLLILVGGMKQDMGMQCAGATAKAFFRTISVPEHEAVGFLNVDAKGAILQHKTALDDVFRAGRRLIGLKEED